jgi:hypothetical protein
LGRFEVAVLADSKGESVSAKHDDGEPNEVRRSSEDERCAVRSDRRYRERSEREPWKTNEVSLPERARTAKSERRTK